MAHFSVWMSLYFFVSSFLRLFICLLVLVFWFQVVNCWNTWEIFCHFLFLLRLYIFLGQKSLLFSISLYVFYLFLFFLFFVLFLMLIPITNDFVFLGKVKGNDVGKRWKRKNIKATALFRKFGSCSYIRTCVLIESYTEYKYNKKS